MSIHSAFKATSALLVSSFALMGCAPAWRDGWGPHMGGSMMGGWLMMSVYGLLGTFLAVLAALFVFRWITGGESASNAALDSLKQRYAKGEINADEYKRMRGELKD